MVDKLLWCCYWMCLMGGATGKWVEGRLDTKENWSFLARFCFLSLDGQFEYLIEFDREMGSPNLLLYYDDESQWPSVYHSDKTCKEREAVLNKAGQNQMIPLSHWYPDTEFSGCVVRNEERELPATKSTTSTTKPPSGVTKPAPESLGGRGSTEDPAYYDQFLQSTRGPTAESARNDTWVELRTTGDYNASGGGGEGDGGGGDDAGLWESVAPERNDSDISNDLKDVEFMFGESDHGKMKKHKRSFEIYDRLKRRRLSAESKGSGATSGEKSGKLVVSCHNARRFRSARERWWFIAISNCDSPKGLSVRYKFLMTNGPEGDFWHEHFSADEFYVLPVLMAYAIAYVLVLVAIALCSVELRSRHLLHSTYKLFVLSVAAQHAGVVMWCLAQARLAANGVGNEPAKIMGQFLCGISEMSYLLLLVLMAKGYTITRARLKVSFTVKLTVFMCCYAVTYVVLFIYQKHSFDPGAVLYLYESPAGYGLVVLRIVAWFMFVYATVFTMKKYPEKSMFYCPFSICGTLWFYAGPLFILTANSYIDKWVRESVVTAVLLFITFCGHVMFLMLTLPVFANKNFPYHVRTTQIGIMETAGSERFGHGMYRPSDVTHAQTVIIPLTRRTEELIGTMYSQYMASAPPLSIEDESKLNGAPKSIVTSSPRLMQQDSTETNTSGDINPSISRSEASVKDEVSAVKRLASKSNDVLENRLKDDVFTVESQMAKLKNEGKGTILQNGHGFLDPKRSPRNDGLFAPKSNYNYEADPNYTKDVNNPILMSANLRSRRNMLKPIAPQDIPPPSWSLAKGPAKPPRKTMFENNGKDDKTEIEPTQLETPPPIIINKKVPPVRNGIKQNSGEISTIHEQYEQAAEGAANKATVDLFAAGNHKI